LEWGRREPILPHGKARPDSLGEMFFSVLKKVLLARGTEGSRRKTTGAEVEGGDGRRPVFGGGGAFYSNSGASFLEESDRRR